MKAIIQVTVDINGDNLDEVTYHGASQDDINKEILQAIEVRTNRLVADSDDKRIVKFLP